MWINLGPEATFTPYLLGSLTGAIPVYLCFAVSLMVTLAFIGATADRAVKDLSNVDKLNAISEKIELQEKFLAKINIKGNEAVEYLEASGGKLNRIIEQENAINQTIGDANQSQVKILNELQDRVNLLDRNLADSKKELLNNIIEQEKALISYNMNLSNRIDVQADEIKDTIQKQFTKVNNSVSQVKRKNTKTANDVKKQKAKMDTIEVKLLKLDKETVKLKDTDMKMGIINVKELKDKLKS
jgi:septal ring factor EnvC (AmiA/AmiB activator)